MHEHLRRPFALVPTHDYAGCSFAYGFCFHYDGIKQWNHVMERQAATTLSDTVVEVTMNRILLVVTLILALSTPLLAGAAQESAGSASRGRYLAGQGVIVPPEEVLVDSYIAQINYNYPPPEGPVGVYLYTANRQLSNRGQESVLHIGIQGETREWDQLAPMNLAFVIGTSASMADENKLEWVESAFELFIDRVRPTDYLSLVVFNDAPTTLVPSVLVSDDE
ncbi:MAG: hypothetical protein V3S41_05990, partial [Spirochaetia bacterium]